MFEQLTSRMNQLEATVAQGANKEFGSTSSTKPKKANKKKKMRDSSSEEKESDSSSSNSSGSSEDELNHVTKSKKSMKKRFKDNDLASIKLKIPEFQGKSDPKAYMDWEEKIENIFDVHEYSEIKKVKLAVVEVFGHTSIWWRKTYRTREE